MNTEFVYAVRNKLTGEYAKNSYYGRFVSLRYATFFNNVGGAKSVITRWRKYLKEQEQYHHKDFLTIYQIEQLNKLREDIENAVVVKLERAYNVIEEIPW